MKTVNVKKIFIIGGASLVILYLAALVLPGISPYAKYPIYYAKCGGKPIIASSFAASYTYVKPGSESYKVDGYSQYFCTSQEAESHNYKELPWDR